MTCDKRHTNSRVGGGVGRFDKKSAFCDRRQKRRRQRRRQKEPNFKLGHSFGSPSKKLFKIFEQERDYGEVSNFIQVLCNNRNR